jgi:hypothetical protein
LSRMSSRHGKALGVAAVLGLTVLGCRPPLDPVVIRFHGVDVRRSEFLKELEPLARNGTDTADPLMRASAFGRFIEEKVVAISAVENGFRDAAEDQAEAERWLTSVLQTETVSEAEARAYYDAHPEVAEIEESVTIREILLTTLQDARDVARILSFDRNAFELLARTRSKSPQAAGGGLLGSFRRGELPGSGSDHRHRNHALRVPCPPGRSTDPGGDTVLRGVAVGDRVPTGGVEGASTHEAIY